MGQAHQHGTAGVGLDINRYQRGGTGAAVPPAEEEAGGVAETGAEGAGGGVRGRRGLGWGQKGEQGDRAELGW